MTNLFETILSSSRAGAASIIEDWGNALAIENIKYIDSIKDVKMELYKNKIYLVFLSDRYNDPPYILLNNDLYKTMPKNINGIIFRNSNSKKDMVYKYGFLLNQVKNNDIDLGNFDYSEAIHVSYESPLEILIMNSENLNIKRLPFYPTGVKMIITGSKNIKTTGLVLNEFRINQAKVYVSDIKSCTIKDIFTSPNNFKYDILDKKEKNKDGIPEFTKNGLEEIKKLFSENKLKHLYFDNHFTNFIIQKDPYSETGFSIKDVKSIYFNI